MAQPKVWLQTDGETTTVHTPFTTRAKDFPAFSGKREIRVGDDFGAGVIFVCERSTLGWCEIVMIYTYMEYINDI